MENEKVYIVPKREEWEQPYSRRLIVLQTLKDLRSPVKEAKYIPSRLKEIFIYINCSELDEHQKERADEGR